MASHRSRSRPHRPSQLAKAPRRRRRRRRLRPSPPNRRAMRRRPLLPRPQPPLAQRRPPDLGRPRQLPSTALYPQRRHLPPPPLSRQPPFPHQGRPRRLPPTALCRQRPRHQRLRHMERQAVPRSTARRPCLALCHRRHRPVHVPHRPPHRLGNRRRRRRSQCHRQRACSPPRPRRSHLSSSSPRSLESRRHPRCRPSLAP